MQDKFEYIIIPDEKDQRLDYYLTQKEQIPVSRSQIKRLIQEGFVKVNDQAGKPGYKLKIDDKVAVIIPPPKKSAIDPEKIELDIVYEDKDLIVINKPRGMVVHPAAGNYSGTLVNALLHHCAGLSNVGGVERPGIVHRLDKFTSGLLVVAKNDKTHQELSKQFEQKTIFKKYIALVHGVVRENQGIIDENIGRNPNNRKTMAVIKDEDIKSRKAITEYKVIKYFKDYTLLEIILKTGRTHQIRVHLTSIGHPIVGDPTYGHRKEAFAVCGQLLHATKLGFIHPRTKKYVEFEKAMPEDMKTVLKKLPEQ